jgi:hypothetical protein
MLALGKRTWTASQDAFPPTDLTDRTFGPMDGGGYGILFADHVWQRYTAPYPYVNCYK